jgi:hypothetical protein
MEFTTPPKVVVTGIEIPRRYVPVSDRTGIASSTDKVTITSNDGSGSLVEVREQTTGTLMP